jgi:hypothetical protein
VAGWNERAECSHIVPASQYPAITGVQKNIGEKEGSFVPYRAYWAQNCSRAATWAPSGGDSLAEDWSILD